MWTLSYHSLNSSSFALGRIRKDYLDEFVVSHRNGSCFSVYGVLASPYRIIHRTESTILRLLSRIHCS